MHLWTLIFEQIIYSMNVSDINECSTNNGNCSDGCQNLKGTYMCTCPTGYEIKSSDKYNCQGMSPPPPPRCIIVFRVTTNWTPLPF